MAIGWRWKHRVWAFARSMRWKRSRPLTTAAVVGQIYRENEVTTSLSAPTGRPSKPEDIGALILSTPTGQRVPCEWWRMCFAGGRFSFCTMGRDAGKRHVAIHGDVQSFVADARRSCGKVPLPKGCISNSAARPRRERRRHASCCCTARSPPGILLLSRSCCHWRNVLVVLFNLPSPRPADARGLLRNCFGSETAGSLNDGSLWGLCALRRYDAQRDHAAFAYEHLVRRKARCVDLATAIRGASERLVPILMTAAVTALGLLPLALNAASRSESKDRWRGDSRRTGDLHCAQLTRTSDARFALGQVERFG